jgi:cytochrome c biogenesis protein CcmG/thiol:disulfide interchange protein DsbE
VTRWLAAAPLLVLVALALVFGLSSLHHDPKVQPMALVGKPLPDLTLPDLDNGQTQSLRALTIGRPALVNVFASWCAPCAEEQAALAELSAGGARIIGVAYKDKPENSRSFLERYGDPYAARLVDASGRAAVDLGVTGPPETYLVAANGLILAKHVGSLSADEGRRLLASAR